MGHVRVWAAAIITVLLLVLLFQNLGTTRIAVLFWSWDLPLLVMMVAFAVLGALLGAIVVLALLAGRGNKPPA